MSHWQGIKLSNFLVKRLSVTEAEAEHMTQDERLGPEPVPFGFVNAGWRELLAQMQPGDELWEFDSPREDWDQLMGSAGIALVRDGEVVRTLTLRMN